MSTAQAILSRCETRWRLLRGVALAGGATALALTVTAAGTAHATTRTLARFTTPGVYTWTVPAGVTSATFNVYGARGGSVLEPSSGGVQVVSSGGAGGEATGKFAVRTGEVFEITVGGQGGTGTVNSQSGTGGFNGGGYGDARTYAAGGGGGSDIRIGGRGDACAAARSCPLLSRIIVGGGGGGGGSSNGGDGGAGGGVSGATASGSQAGVGGGQEQSGPCPPTSVVGGFGVGGYGDEWSGVGGAGGGWYGGCTLFLGGGGGSGYISQLATSGSFPTPTNLGDGKVIITTT